MCKLLYTRITICHILLHLPIHVTDAWHQMINTFKSFKLVLIPLALVEFHRMSYVKILEGVWM